MYVKDSLLPANLHVEMAEMPKALPPAMSRQASLDKCILLRCKKFFQMYPLGFDESLG